MDVPQLSEKNFRILRELIALSCVGLAIVGLAGCTTLPRVPHESYRFPKDVYFGDPGKPYQGLGQVRTRVLFPSLDMDEDENTLCRNYFNKAAADLLKLAKENGGEAVIDLKSVVFLGDGRVETHAKAECADDGMEGEVLAQGIAVKWKPAPDPSKSEVQHK